MLKIDQYKINTINSCTRNNSINTIKSDKSNFSYIVNNLAAFNSEHLKANFLTFLGDEKKDESIKPAAPPVPQVESKKLPGEIIVLNNQFVANPEQVLTVNHYDTTVKNIASFIYANKNVMVTYDPGSRPELLANALYKMLNKDTFNKHNTRETEVIVLDPIRMLKNGINDPVFALQQLEVDAAEKSTHKIVFIKDFDQLLPQMYKHSLKVASYDPAIFFDTKTLPPYFHIVPLMPTTMDQQYSDVSQAGMIDQQRIKDSFNKNFEKLKLSPPSPNAIKEELMTNKLLLAEALPKGLNIEIQQDAINRVVDFATKARNGVFPDKALELIRFVATFKFLAQANNKKAGPMSLNSQDVDSFIKFHPQYKKPPMSASGRFRVVYDTGVTLNDVGGAKQAKEVVNEILNFIKTPEKYQKQGAKIPKGLLLTGEPGNGKTLLAKAIAGEVSVPFIPTSGSEFVQKYVGEGAARIRDLFDFAREQARNHDSKTAIIFIDEFDSLAKKRSSGGASGGESESEQTLNQLLVEMDGIKSDDYEDTNIIIIAGTNRPDLLSKAVTRPGRIDYKIEVPNPARDVDARYEILQIHAKNKTFNLGDAFKSKDDLIKEVAERTSGASGAMLADIMNKAALIASNDKSRNSYAITYDDIINAKLEAVAGRVVKNNNPTWKKEHTIAHECGHALVRQTLLNFVDNNINKDNKDIDVWWKPDEIDLITLEPRGQYLGAVFSKPGENVSVTLPSVISSIASAVGGHSVEKLLYGMNGSWGISSDLETATNMAKQAITKMGMGPNTGIIAVNNDPDLSKMMQPELKEDLKIIINSANKISEAIIEFHKDFITGYVDKFNKLDGNNQGGNNLTGKQFKEDLKNWLISTGKINQLPELEAKLKNIIDEIQKPNKK